MKKQVFAANWKMHMGPKETQSFCQEFLPLVAGAKNLEPAKTEIIIFAPFVSLPILSENLKGTTIAYGAQNCSFEAKGAFTGEISVGMLKELGCTHVLVGHSERRQLFGETNDTCAKKLKAIVDGGLIPMLCVGETQAERDQNLTEKVITTQLTESLKLWDRKSPVVIAYEPVWAIGTGKVATPQMAEETHKMTRAVLNNISSATQSMPLLYGGSVKPENAGELLSQPSIDGFLVGGASLLAKSFAQISQIPL